MGFKEGFLGRLGIHRANDKEQKDMMDDPEKFVSTPKGGGQVDSPKSGEAVVETSTELWGSTIQELKDRLVALQAEMVNRTVGTRKLGPETSLDLVDLEKNINKLEEDFQYFESSDFKETTGNLNNGDKNAVKDKIVGAIQKNLDKVQAELDRLEIKVMDTELSEGIKKFEEDSE